MVRKAVSAVSCLDGGTTTSRRFSSVPPSRDHPLVTSATLVESYQLHGTLVLSCTGRFESQDKPMHTTGKGTGTESLVGRHVVSVLRCCVQEMLHSAGMGLEVLAAVNSQSNSLRGAGDPAAMVLPLDLMPMLSWSTRLPFLDVSPRLTFLGHPDDDGVVRRYKTHVAMLYASCTWNVSRTPRSTSSVPCRAFSQAWLLGWDV